MVLMLSFLTVIFFCSSLFASTPESRSIDCNFANYPDKKNTIDTFAPSDSFSYDVGEKYAFYHKDETNCFSEKQ